VNHHDLFRRCADSLLSILAIELLAIEEGQHRLFGASTALSVSIAFMTRGRWLQFAFGLKGIAPLVHSNHRSVQWVWSSIFTCSYRVFSVSHVNGLFHVIHSSSCPGRVSFVTSRFLPQLWGQVCLKWALDGFALRLTESTQD